jgi:2-keto-4-pentenoate hydratase/2-oxohepta-3-ene-1,7-dioic acid hydratase in catechol pathway
MKYLARTSTGRSLLGDETGFVPLDAAHPGCRRVRDALPRAAAGTLAAVDEAPATPTPRDRLTFGPPLEEFGTLWGIGLNYADHAADLAADHPDEPASFLRPERAVTGPGGPIRLPPPEQSERVTAEGELAVVVGRRCRDVDVDGVADVIAGYLPVVDVTAEDVLQRNPRFLTRAKSYDTFLVVGPTIAVPDEPTDLGDRQVRTVKNGRVEAENRVANMYFSPHELVAFHSAIATLGPGDLFSTGTPGATSVGPGDDVRAVVDGIGSVDATVTR